MARCHMSAACFTRCQWPKLHASAIPQSNGSPHGGSAVAAGVAKSDVNMTFNFPGSTSIRLDSH